MLTISSWYGFSPARSAALRNVPSCMFGEQAATTTPVSSFSRMTASIMSCPGCEQKCLFVDATCYTPDCGGPQNPDPQIASR